MNQAISLERRSGKAGVSKALKDCLNRAVAEYNKMVTVRRHRIENVKKGLIYNLFLGQTAKMTMSSCNTAM